MYTYTFRRVSVNGDGIGIVHEVNLYEAGMAD